MGEPSAESRVVGEPLNDYMRIRMCELACVNSYYWRLDTPSLTPDAILTYKRSNVVSAIHSDTSYLRKTLARSQVCGHFLCLSNVDDPPNNGTILNISKILKAVMSSAAEDKLGALYINAHEAIPMRQVLQDMGHKQLPTPIQTNNSTAHSMVTNNIQQ